jgi:cobalamin biosynthesis Mg chelatase CobN
MKFPKNNSVFSSAIGATPNPIDKKKYFYPTPQPAPAPAPTPITPPLPINQDLPGGVNNGLLNFTLQRQTTQQSNSNAGLGSPGYGQTENRTQRPPEPQNTTKGAPILETTKKETEKTEEKPVSLSWFKKNQNIIVGIVVVIAISVAVYFYAKNQK